MKITVKRLKQLFREAADTSGKLHVGDVVRSNVNAQGMTKGARYVVRDSKTKHMFGGGYTTYIVEPEDGGKQLTVGNGHLVLTLVEPGSRLGEASKGKWHGLGTGLGGSSFHRDEPKRRAKKASGPTIEQRAGVIWDKMTREERQMLLDEYYGAKWAAEYAAHLADSNWDDFDAIELASDIVTFFGTKYESK